MVFSCLKANYFSYYFELQSAYVQSLALSLESSVNVVKELQFLEHLFLKPGLSRARIRMVPAEDEHDVYVEDTGALPGFKSFS